MRVGIQGARPVGKHSLGGRRATSRAESVREASTDTLDLIHRPVSALCEIPGQVLKILIQALEPLKNRSLSKTGAVAGATLYLGEGVVVLGLCFCPRRSPAPTLFHVT